MSTTNLTLEQANNLLAQIGVAAVVVANPAEATPDANIDDLATSVTKSEPAEGFTEEDVRKAEKKAEAKLFGTFRSAIGSTFGIKTNELEGLEAKDLAAKVKDVTNSRYQAQNTELAGQVEDLTRQLNGKDEEFTTKYAEQDRNWEQRISERDVLDYTVGVFDNIPKRGGNSRTQAKTALNQWRSSYDVRYDEASKEVRFYVKGTDDLVMDGKNPIKADKLGKDFFTEMGLDVSDTSHVDPRTVMGQQGSGGFNNQGNGMGVPQANENDNFSGLMADISSQV